MNEINESPEKVVVYEIGSNLGCTIILILFFILLIVIYI